MRPAARHAYHPGLPPQRDMLAQHMPMGSVIKYWVAYEKPFWRERGLNGMLQSDQPPSAFISGDFTPAEGRPELMAGFIEAHHSTASRGRWRQPHKKQRKTRINTCLIREACATLLWA